MSTFILVLVLYRSISTYIAAVSLMVVKHTPYTSLVGQSAVSSRVLSFLVTLGSVGLNECKEHTRVT